MKGNTENNVETSLRRAGLRVTLPRVSVLRVLLNTPRSLEELKQAVKKDTHQATVYRAIKDLVSARVIRRIETPLGTRYEYQSTHHHHITCVSCGRIEEVQICIPLSVKQAALRSARSFSKIEDHSLEFSGTCSPCEARS